MTYHRGDEEEYIRPSRYARVLLVLYILLLVLLAWLAQNEVDSLQNPQHASRAQLEADIQSLLELIDYLFIFTVSHALLFSVYFCIIATKALRTGRYPPPGTRVIKRTKISRGKKAVYLAWLTYVFALIVWLPVLIPVKLVWFVAQFS